jgi:hypothetical protein
MALQVLTQFFEKPWTKIISSYLLVLALGVGLGVWGTLRWQKPPDPVVRTVVDTKYVEVPKEKIVYKDVVKYVKDTVEVKKLTDEIRAQKGQIASLTETIASYKPVTVAGPTEFVQVPGAPEAHFKDWRLTFDAVGPKTTYALDQKFESLVAVGKDKSGAPQVTTKIFEVGPGETRTELTDKSVTHVVAVPNTKGWYFGGSIQAGFSYSYDTGKKAPVAGGVVGLKWLQRGYSKAAEDGIWSVLTPAAFITSDGLEPAVLPVSVNLGRIPKQPFKDLWVSPVLAFGKAPNISPTRLGFSLTATF